MTPEKQVSPVIRLSQGERDASARATHLEAATRKFLVTTIERKQMSTKTNFKRVALVAITALGLGVLSSVPAKAVGDLTVTVVNGSFGAGSGDSRTAATISIAATIEDVRDTITISVAPNGTLGDSVTAGAFGNGRQAKLIYLDTNTAARTIVGDVASAATLTTPEATVAATKTGLESNTVTGALPYKIRSESIGRVGAKFGIQVDSSSAAAPAGTYSFTVFVKQYTQGVAQPVTTTYTASLVVAELANVSLTPSAVTSFVKLSTAGLTSSATTSTLDVVTTSVATAGTTAGYILVGNRNADNGSETAEDSITATVTGVGNVCTSSVGVGAAVGSVCGKSVKIAATGDYQFALQADGIAGTSTITIASSVAGYSVVKQASYYAKAAKTLTASVLTPVLAVGANDSALSVSAVDANGTNWSGAAYIYASTAADVTAVGGSTTTPVACVYSSSKLVHYCPIAATAAGSGKFKVIDAATVALATATSNEVTVKSSAATAASIKIAFNKATYAPGEVGQIIVTPLDASGAGIAAGSTASALASGGITSNVGLIYNSTAVDMTSTTVTNVAYSGTTTVGGSQVFMFTAPLSGGAITLTAKGGSGLPTAGQVAITATASVTDNGAAALAAVTALATTVASLKTLITTLTNLVLKIQKKVKA